MKAVRPILVVLFVTAFARLGMAQWVPLNNFSGIVSCVFFVDGSVGFVGVNQSIYRTQDGGTTWTIVMQGLSGDPTAFDFKDGLNGWCSVAGDAGTPACYKTNNAGRSWGPLVPTGDASDVHYNQANHVLLLSIRNFGTGSLVSTNDGSTWSNITNVVPITDENGFTFIDGQTAILSAYTTTYYRTINGGTTWTNTNYIKHSWSPCAVPGTLTILAAEDQSNRMYRSDDAGLSWIGSPSPGGILTGCVQAGQCGVYVQTGTNLYVSSDYSTWTALAGPGNSYDTRFYVGGAGIYAANFTGTLYRLPAGVGIWPTLQFTPNALSISEAAGCKEEIEFAKFQNLSCGTLTVLGASIKDTTNWRLIPTKFPVILKLGDTTQFSFSARSKSLGVFAQGLHLRIQTNGSIVDTTFPLTLSVLGILPPTLHTVSVTLPDRCTPLDTVFRIHNNHCDTIALTILSMRDSALFAIGDIKLPALIPPDSDLLVPVRIRAKDHGTFTDSVALGLTYGTYTLDTTLGLSGTVHVSSISALLNPAALSFDSLSQCDTVRRILYLHNNSCDSVEITEVIGGGSGRFSITALKLPIWIHSGDSIAIEAEMPGTGGFGYVSDNLEVMLNTGVSERLLTISLSGTVTPSIPRVTISAGAVTMDSILPCTTFDTMISVSVRGLCSSAVIDAAYLTGKDSILGSGLFVPVFLSPDSLFRYHITYRAVSGRVADAQLHLHGTSLDTIVDIHLSVRTDTGAHLTLSAPRTSLTARVCETDSTTLNLDWGGCAPGAVAAISLVTSDPAQTQFEMDTVTVPEEIMPSRGLAIHVRFRGDGTGDGRATIVVRESNGTIHSVALTGASIPAGSARLALVLASGSELHPVSGDVMSANIVFADAIDAMRALQSVRVRMTVDGDILTNESAVGENGWTATPEAVPQGTLQWLCTRVTSTPISAGDHLMSLRFRAAISDSLSAPITLTNVTFSPDDPNYERCILSSSITQSRLDAGVTPVCGDSTLSGFIRRNQIVLSVNVHPNPVGVSSSDLTIAFTASERTELTLSVLDILGRVRSESAYRITPGENVIAQSVSSLEPGMYSVVIEASGTREVRRVMVMR